jgi:hypothetical protein
MSDDVKGEDMIFVERRAVTPGPYMLSPPRRRRSKIRIMTYEEAIRLGNRLKDANDYARANKVWAAIACGAFDGERPQLEYETPVKGYPADQAEFWAERGLDDDDGYHDLLVWVSAAGRLCIPAPLVDQLWIALALRNGAAIVPLREHGGREGLNAGYIDVTDVDALPGSWIVPSTLPEPEYA